jgi:hypothetical protein
MKLQKKDRIIKHLQKKLDSYHSKSDEKSLNNLNKNWNDQKEAVIFFIEQLDVLVRNQLNPAVSSEPIDYSELSKVIEQILNVNKANASNKLLEQEFALIYVTN